MAGGRMAELVSAIARFRAIRPLQCPLSSADSESAGTNAQSAPHESFGDQFRGHTRGRANPWGDVAMSAG
eukprot:11841525-Alexandrium_andersonii.AAC.1